MRKSFQQQFDKEIDKYVKLTKLTNKIFHQQYGTFMGNSLYPFIANSFMGMFETDIGK